LTAIDAVPVVTTPQVETRVDGGSAEHRTLRVVPDADRDGYARVEARLVARFSPPLPPEAVKRCVLDCAAMFEGARVRTYLPVLIERAAADRLAEVIEDGRRRMTRQAGE
jgi:hypothetical protein